MPSRLQLERVEVRTPTLPPATTTNCYLVGDAEGFYLVEPATPYGPARRALFERVRAWVTGGARLLGAVLTHHHVDHVGAAAAFRAEFGAPVYAHAETRARLAGRVEVDALLDDGDRLLGGALDVLHTPGHAPGHVCLFHRAAGWLVAGDMVASVGTIVIDPDDAGDMDAYLASLRRLIALAPRQLLPAHGDPIDDAVGRLEFYVSHRLAREARVLDAVPPAGTTPAEITAIVAAAYADTSPLLWPLAALSARAHLARLERAGRVRRADAAWARVT